MADISNVINVPLLGEGRAVAADNINVVSIITGRQGVLSSAERFRTYKTSAAVAADCGASSAEASFATSFFATSPNSISAGGVLVLGYWRASDETIDASAATLVSEQNSAAALIPILNQISDGSFAITVDGGLEQEVTGLNFQTVSDLDDAKDILDTAITGATVTQSNGFFTITSDTTGATSTLTYLEDAATGTNIAATLGLSSETGAVLTQGAASSTLTAESKLEGIAAIKAAVNIKGAAFIDKILDADVPGIAAWAKANSVIVYETFSGASYLTKATSNPVWQVVLSSQSNFRCLFSKAGNRKMAVSYMARNHVVNFAGQNTAITMNLKTLSIAAEDYSQTELDAAKAVGLDVYTTIKDVPMLLTSGANDFVDNVYNLMAFVDAVQSNSLTYLKVTPTKIAQTDEGIDGIVDDVEKTCSQFVRANVFNPGTWTLSDFFGDRQQFLDAIKQQGFYVLAGDLADQSTADRQARKSPVIQVAVKNSGAVHSEDIIINFNK